MNNIVDQQRAYLAQLLEAIQRSAWFLDQSQCKLTWPVSGDNLAKHRKDVDLFETLAAINERFAKLQDSLGAAMRHAALLMGEDPDNFLQLLATFEKWGILDSVETWQQCRVVRNMAAHDYDLDYAGIAEHLNTLQSLTPFLFTTARHFVHMASSKLGLEPASGHFRSEFNELTH